MLLTEIHDMTKNAQMADEFWRSLIYTSAPEMNKARLMVQLYMIFNSTRKRHYKDDATTLRSHELSNPWVGPAGFRIDHSLNRWIKTARVMVRIPGNDVEYCQNQENNKLRNDTKM